MNYDDRIESFRKNFIDEIIHIDRDNDNYHKHLSLILESIDKFATVDFEVAALEIGYDFYKFTLVFPENQTIMATKTLNPDSSLGYNELVFSYFKNKERIASNQNNEDAFIKGLIEYFNKNGKISNTHTNS
jgi:hypothetical protein